ncbi:multicopper oxidase domain-containing protein [Nitrosovibrio sp. Nv17]|jgi:FtsP/CotA-like multicopper oxidase with cupredoxin domain|uniref:multicopper oxidase domain-containing protein n=1 Tax=Nitrosovibrio sp. Nv17 TaxID=1855339 RepID=UPI0009084F74|nr:multicopper oxidase domain-containing protein [Nitrosovibrio sp. Nv17]SFW26912.1 Multicopper oxidase [Nitrosovibrio sp. Nv17]
MIDHHQRRDGCPADSVRAARHAGGRFAALVVFFLGCWAVLPAQAAVREYWIAAEKAAWNYAPSGQNRIRPEAGLGVWGETLSYTKYRYVGYADGSYAKPLPQPEWMGILGPQLRAVVGDTLKVHFLNRTDRPLSIHPHGVFYSKDNEGADGDAAGAAVPPGKAHTYTWIVDEDAGPGPADPSSIAWLYHSHVMEEEEANLGLVGTILVTRGGMAHSDSNPAPRDVDQEFTALYMIFNEEEGNEGGMKHAINGRIFGNLEGYETRIGQRVRWHIVALGNETDNHTVHWHGQTVLVRGHRTDVVEVLPASMISVDMAPRSAGDWLFHCHVDDHMMAGMSTRWYVRP